MGMTAIKHGKCFVQGLILRKSSVIAATWSDIFNIGILTKISKRVFTLPQVWGGKNCPFYFPSQTSAFCDMPCVLTTDISVIWPNRRDQECGKSKTAAKAQILCAVLSCRKKNAVNGMTPIPTAAHSQNSFRPWQDGSCF